MSCGVRLPSRMKCHPECSIPASSDAPSPGTTRRLRKEIRNLEDDTLTADGISAHPAKDGKDLFHWTGSLVHPTTEANLKVDIHIPPTYPLAPPRLILRPRIWHPNVCPKSGGVSLPDCEEKNWCPALCVRHLLISLQALLAEPKLDWEEGCVLNEEAVEMWIGAKWGARVYG